MASFPSFFHDALLKQGAEVWLDEDTAKHVVQVLRMEQGEKLQLTDGKGHVAIAIIATTAKKKCSVTIDEVNFYEAKHTALHLAIAFTKNTSRNEWLLEKATEMGVSSIIPLVVTRSEKERIRHDRWTSILVSAMLQSQQCYLPHLIEPQELKQVLKDHTFISQKLVAHCNDGMPRVALSKAVHPQKETLILIGPEGDFTQDEVKLCEDANFTGIALGNNRLRTETAAMAVCAYFYMVNNE